MHRNTLSRRRTIGARYARTSAEGGGGGAPAGGQDGAGAPDSGQQAQDAAQQPDAGQAGAQQAATQQAAQWDGKVESLPEGAQKVIRDLRAENAQRRTGLTAAEQKQQDMVRAFAKAAGIELPDDQQAPDPAELTKQVTEREARARQAELKLAVFQAAPEHGADPNRLLKFTDFLDAVREVDPTDTEAIKTAINKAVTENAWLKAGRVPGASGADHTGGSGEGAVSQAQFDAMSAGQRQTLYQTDPDTYRRLAGR